MENTVNVRLMALDLLCGCESGGRYSSLALDSALKSSKCPPADRALLTTLVYGVTERQLTLDYYIDLLSSLPPSKLEPRVRTAIRLGLYQLVFMDRIPAHAAVNESVSLVPRRATGFTNALLRRFIRERDSLPLPDRNTRLIKYLSVKYSFPEPLCRRFTDIFGEARCEALLAAIDESPGLTLRVNTLKISRDNLISQIAKTAPDAQPTLLSPDGIRLQSVPPRSLPGFDDGLFFVQDEASQLCVRALDARPGMTVVDACSAPGSKSFGAAMSMNDNGKILSFDLHENKISLIRSGAARLGINIIEAQARDSRVCDEAMIGNADRVLCDVPCSGFGVMAKKPEIRYKDLAESAALPDIQYAILESCSRYVKPGGALVYSTCTLLPEENELNVERFLREHGDFEPAKLEIAPAPDTYMLTLAPDTHQTDGFFIAKLMKKP